MPESEPTPAILSPLPDRDLFPKPRAPRPPLNLEPYEWRIPVGVEDASASAEADRSRSADHARLTGWASIFGNDHPVELEVGSGKGLFLANAAALHPDRNFLGVEVKRKFARKAMERLAKRRFGNVKVHVGDIHRLFRMAPLGRLEAVHIYFPDPWWKKRHKKRRVFREDFVDAVARALRPGGEFRIATDVEEYFGVIMAIMQGRTDFGPLPSPLVKPAEHDADYLTNFERKYRLEGRAIYRAAFRSAERSFNGRLASRDQNSVPIPNSDADRSDAAS